jgi:hypothetical protein
MNEARQVKPVTEDASTFTQFINIVGDISQTLYLAKHPEENGVLPAQFERERMNEYPDLYAPWHTKLQEACL